MFNIAGASFTDPVFSLLCIIAALWRFVTMSLKIADFSLSGLGASSRPPDLSPTLSNSSRKIRSHRRQGRCNVHEVKGLAACLQRSWSNQNVIRYLTSPSGVSKAIFFF
jgi:hypothetical protein